MIKPIQFIAFLLVALVLSMPVLARNISGKVTDAVTGKGLSGVTVSAKSIKIQTKTNKDGKFSISVPGTEQILVFNLTSFTPKEVKIENQQVLNVQLKKTPVLEKKEAEALVQFGKLSGKVLDKTTREPIAFGAVVLKHKGVQKDHGTTDINGVYAVSRLQPGTYSVEVSYVGYKKLEVKGVVITANKTKNLNLNLEPATTELKEVTVQAYREPIIGPEKVGQTITSEQIHKIATVDVSSLANTAAGTQSKDDGRGIRLRGSRTSGTTYYVNGVKQLVSPSAPQEFNTEAYDAIHENEFLEARKNALSTFSIDVDNASYSNMRRFLTEGQLPPKDAVRTEEMMNYFRYSYPQPLDKAPFSVTTELAVCPWNKDNQLLHIGLKGKEIATENLPPSNLVFLLDVSGSMMDENKLPLVKSGFKMLVEKLRPEDNVAIVVYAGAAGLVLPSTKGNQKEEILAAIDQLQAGGSTAGGEGINLAYNVAQENFRKGGNNRVILATDGDFNIGVSSDAEMERLIEQKRESGIFLTVLGFGSGNLKDSKMEKIADKGNGNYAYIDNIGEAKKVFINEFGGTLFTIAKDVKLQLEFNPATIKAYRLIGYENRALWNEDFNNDKKDAGDMGSGHTVTALYEIIPAKSKRKLKVDSVDPLKYQQNTLAPDALSSGELVTLKLRYKEPDGNKSSLIQITVKANALSEDQTSENFRFSAAVAQFGMLLRDSEFKGKTSYEKVISMAQDAKGKDEGGHREEFIKLVNTAKTISVSAKK
jgi:Ca-activated chloride channel family protein